MPPFEIWPSEALLLGYSVGYYSGGSVFQKFVAHLRETLFHPAANRALCRSASPGERQPCDRASNV